MSPSDEDAPNLYQGGGPATVRFVVDTDLRLRTGHHSIALMRDDRLVWGMEVQNFALDPGTHHLEYHFAGLPLLPGAYTWRLVFYDHRGVIDSWDCRPHLVIGGAPLVYARPEWTGIVDVPCTFEMTTAGAPEASVALR